jgi:hypothetical protein
MGGFGIRDSEFGVYWFPRSGMGTQFLDALRRQNASQGKFLSSFPTGAWDRVQVTRLPATAIDSSPKPALLLDNSRSKVCGKQTMSLFLNIGWRPIGAVSRGHCPFFVPKMRKMPVIKGL